MAAEATTTCPISLEPIPPGALVRLGGVAFDVAILRGDVDHMAPHPAGMVAAITRLGIGQGRAVAVVDTTPTRDAAQAAGLPYLAFPGRLASGDTEPFGEGDLPHALSPEALTSAWRGIRNQAAE